MTSLRKACRRCTTSKRKCIVQLPKCVRCAQTGHECVYDLEHLNAPSSHHERMPNFTWNPATCDSPGYCVMKPLTFRSPFNIDPTSCVPYHPDTLEIIQFGYLSVPALASRGKPMMFFHPKLQLQRECDHFANLMAKWEDDGQSHEHFQHLLQVDVSSISIQETLPALQALMMYLARFLFSANQIQQRKAENALDVLSDWTQHLLTSAQSKKPQHLSAWQEWLYGESTRRTIIMSYTLNLCYKSFKFGICSNWLFVESLPFDRRVGLWMAESPQAWIATARAKTGDRVGEQLSSFHEFAENSGSTVDFCGDMFLTLFAGAHNGKAEKARLRHGGI